MLGAVAAALDISSLRQLACTALVLLAGVLFLVKKATSRYFVVDAGFEGTEGYHALHRMPIGSGGGVQWECAVCSSSANKRCSRCKSVRYCSQVCQSNHWEAEHKSKCRQVRSLDNIVTCGTGSRRKSSSVSLIPCHSTRKLLKEPKTFLFPYDEFVKLFDWDKPGFPPCGLMNCGNSCFANVVLQCLTCTRPLVAYFLEKNHSRGCSRRRDDWCFLCELQIHIKRSSANTKPFSPVNILSRLPNIGGNLGYGRQEDAHEFMRFAIDTMQSICLEEYGGEKAVDPGTQETTIVQYIFGGHLQSQVICTKCDLVSNRYENMMDLTVEIQGGAECLEECLNQFTAKEWLDGENMYKCDGCNDYVKAWKQLTVHQAPNVLTIALKRFQSGRFGKLKKRVTFPENLNLTPYMSANGDGTDQYTLYGVIVHLDMLNSSFFGHYICYIKDYQGLWYKIDDCKVMNVEVEEVLAQGAYMLLYHRRNPRKEPFVKPMEPTTMKSLAEADLETPKTQGSIDYSACVISSMPKNTEPLLQPKSSHPEMLTDFLMLRDTGNERSLEVKLDSSNEKKPKHIHLDANEVLTDPDLGLAGELGMDLSFPNPTEVKDAEFENSNFSKDVSSIKPILSKTFSPTKLCLTVGEATECRELHSCSDANLDMVRNVPVDIRVIPEQTPVDNDLIMQEMSTSPTPTSSSDQAPPLAMKPESEPAVRNCESLGLANGIFSRDTSLEYKRPNKVWEDGSRGKSKTTFPRGFLNKPAQKKPAEDENASQTKIHRASVLPLDDEFSNGHLVPFSNMEIENGEAATHIHVSQNGGEISPVSEEACLSQLSE